MQAQIKLSRQRFFASSPCFASRILLFEALGHHHSYENEHSIPGSYFFVIHATLVHLQYFFTAKSAASIE
jgi:uncharacterized protein with PQ loop repeat